MDPYSEEASDYVKAIYELFLILKTTRYIEAYCGLVYNSDLGHECPYAKTAKRLFLTENFKESEKILQAIDNVSFTYKKLIRNQNNGQD